MSSENASARRPVPKGVVAGFFVFSALGFLDATYLTIEHLRSAVPPCSLAGGCETVLTSQYATIGSVPIASIGALYYLAVFMLVFAYVDSSNVRWLKLAGWLSVLGFAVSLVLVYLQFIVLKALCQYCLLSAGTSTGLFLLSLAVLKVRQSAVQSPLVVGQGSGNDKRN